MPPISLRMLAARGAGWKLGSDVLGRLMQYVLLWAAARALAPSDFGDFTFALSIGFMVAQVADFGLQLYVQRELSRLVVQDAASPPYFTSEAQAGRLLGGALAIKAVLSAVALAAFALLVVVEPVGNKGALLVVGASMVLSTALEFVAYCFRALGRLKYEAAANLVARGLNFALGLLVLWLGGAVLGLALTTLAAMTAALAFAYTILRRYVRPVWRPDWAAWRRSAGQPTAVGIGIVFSIVSFRVDNLLIPPLLGTGQLALYNVGYKLFEPALIIPGVVLAATFPLLSQAGAASSLRRDRFRALMGPTTLALFALGLAAAASMWLLAGPVIGLLYGGAYSGSVPVLQMLAPACVPMFLNYALTHGLIAVDRPSLYAIFTLASLFVNVGANLLLLPALGVTGAAAATVLTEVALFVLCAAGMVRFLAASRSRSEPEPEAAL
ncbi:MAG TPA: flippase [Chloroflexia bacterium]|nr:flippase [Chloroflexia bacterium]